MSLNLNITGLEKLQSDLKEAQRASESLNDTITTVKIDPANLSSVTDAIRQMEAAVDGKIAPYRANQLVSQMAQAMKQAYRQQILERAKRVQR